jgi:predicted MFS family arabinose efflux permease
MMPPNYPHPPHRKARFVTDSSVRVRLAGAALVALATTLMLESLRVFVAYLVFIIDQSQRVALAGIAVGVFLAIGLGGVLARRLGPRRALLACAALCGLARMTLQFWEAPTPRVVLGALVVISWGWLLLAAFEGGLPREAVAQGVPLGLGLDLALRIAFGSLDLPWDPTTA